MTDLDRAGEIETEKDIGTKPGDEVTRWLKEIELSEEEEKDWRKDVKEALEVYAGEEGKVGTKFNLYHANVQTIIPAIYNSLPEPDVRRRHGDRDPVAKQSADVLERILAHEIDGYDFNGTIEAVVQDLTICGRGIARVTYRATTAPLNGEDGSPLLDETGQPVHDVAYQSVGCAYVPWATYRHGPGRTFAELPWIAFASYYTRKALRELATSKEVADKVALDMQRGNEKEGASDDDPVPQDIFKRALVWEVWDRDERKVHYVSPGYKDGLLNTVDDPLGLEQFFPIPKPAQGAVTTGSLIPICEHKLIKPLLDELDIITKRITALVAQLRVRGIIAGGEGSTDLQTWAEAKDGELVEAAKLGALMDKGSIENLIGWWPLDPTVKALEMLYQQRESIKQSIYEATGIADILRGQSNPNETLGAQEIKQQWGSLRIQKRQQEVQRFIRDLFRLKAEIIANKFTKENLILASGLQDDPILTGAPQQGQPPIGVQSPPPDAGQPGVPPLSPAGPSPMMAPPMGLQ